MRDLISVALLLVMVGLGYAQVHPDIAEDAYLDSVSWFSHYSL